MIYRTACPACRACTPVRVRVADFQPNRSQRRAYRKADELFRVEQGPPMVDRRRVELYNLHKRGRRLTHGEPPISVEGYASFLVDSCCETFELRYYLDEELVGVAVADRAARSMSAVYFIFDPCFEKLSLGTFSVLKQIELCRQWQLDYLYLGFFLEAPSRMAYKGHFRPQERLLDGVWTEVTEA